MVGLHSQPRGFSIFFLTEMWERYGFYVVQTLLIFYLLRHWHLGDKEAYVIVGSFTALAYINSIFGGMIADKFTGTGRTLIFGGILLFIGYCVLGATRTHVGLNLGLACVTVGTGLLKPNVSSLLSIIYKNGDIRKDAGYTIYYMGIYVGALGGSLLGGYLQTLFGWSVAFYSAAFGGALASLIALYGRFKYQLFDLRKSNINYQQYLFAFVSAIVLIGVSFVALDSELLSSLYYSVVAMFVVGVLVYCIVTNHGNARRKLIAFSLLIFMAVIYWGIFFQQFFSISLAASRTTLTSIPYSSLPTAETLGVILFGPIVNLIWKYFQKRSPISVALKFSFGFLFNAVCFLFLALALLYAHSTNQHLGVWVIVIAYFLIAIGELCLSPTSLSMVTSLVPERFLGVMMGVSLLSIGFGGGKLASVLASFSAMKPSTISMLSSEQVYMHAFFNYFIISGIAFIIMLLLSSYISKLVK